MNKLAIILGGVIILVSGFILFRLFSEDSQISVPTSQQSVSPLDSESPQTKVIAEKLDIPWSLVFLPDKSILVTERPGRVRLVDSNSGLQSEPVATLSVVKEVGEGGLLGIALHPDFTNNKYVYLYYTYTENNGNTLNRVVRMTYQDNKLNNEQIIIDQIPGASNHNGGRIKFGPDNFLYITTGDAQNPSQAQDINNLSGKILRVTDKGEAALGNPFNNLVYSYGHRNPQGLAWDNKGQLWATEHGRSGVSSGLDEINLIEKGKNYGWPIIQGNEIKTGMETAKFNSGESTWAPAGAVIIDNSLFFGGLRGQTLYEAVTNEDQITLKEHFQEQFGRIRDVILGPDNFLYITTSNRDGRGSSTVSDDRIIRVNPQKP